MVVFPTPLLGQHLRLQHATKLLGVQQLIPNANSSSPISLASTSPYPRFHARFRQRADGDISDMRP